MSFYTETRYYFISFVQVENTVIALTGNLLGSLQHPWTTLATLFIFIKLKAFYEELIPTICGKMMEIRRNGSDNTYVRPPPPLPSTIVILEALLSFPSLGRVYFALAALPPALRVPDICSLRSSSIIILAWPTISEIKHH